MATTASRPSPIAMPERGMQQWGNPSRPRLSKPVPPLPSDYHQPQHHHHHNHYPPQHRGQHYPDQARRSPSSPTYPGSPTSPSHAHANNYSTEHNNTITTVQPTNNTSPSASNSSLTDPTTPTSSSSSSPDSSASAAAAIIDVVPPLTRVHFYCYHSHRTLVSSRNTHYPLPCMTCLKTSDKGARRWRCSFCCLRICTDCAQGLQKHKDRSLMDFMEELVVQLEMAEEKASSGRRSAEQEEGVEVTAEVEGANP